MERALDLADELLNNQRYPISRVAAECWELFEAILTVDIAGIMEEFSDVAWASQLCLWQRLKINAPLFGVRFTVSKFRERNKIWSSLFFDEGILFKTDYLVAGSNFARTEKVAAAFAAAGVELSQFDVTRLSRKAISLTELHKRIAK